MGNIYFLYFIFLNSLILLSINLLYLIKSNKKNELNKEMINDLKNELYKKIYLKNNDNYFINFTILPYMEMANKLKTYKTNSELFDNISLITKTKTSKINKKTLLVKFVDNYNYEIDIIKKILESNYIIKITPENPDYLIYNVFSCEHLEKNYSNSIKIAIFTENQIPDFNSADYAISQSHIKYLDRHFTFPNSFFNNLLLFNKYYKKARNKLLRNPIRKKFCAAVISNTLITDYFRINFINELNKYKIVDMGGKYNNNVGIIKNKIDFLSSYKFSIAMENTEGDGYISEKILDSFLSGTIPIYYGSYMLDEFINPKAFILIKGEKDILQKIEYIKKIDNNEQIYRDMIKENVLIDKNIFKKYKIEYEEFLFHIFDQEKNRAKRIDYIIK